MHAGWACGKNDQFVVRSIPTCSQAALMHLPWLVASDDKLLLLMLQVIKYVPYVGDSKRAMDEV
jgi:hypothetical protein